MSRRSRSSRTSRALLRRLRRGAWVEAPFSRERLRISRCWSSCGVGASISALDRALALEAQSAGLRIIGQPSWVLAMLHVWTGELDAARTTVERDAPPRSGDGGRGRDPVHSQFPEPPRLGRRRLGGCRSLRRRGDRRGAPERSGTESRFGSATKALVAAHRGVSMPRERSSTEGLALAAQTGHRPADSSCGRSPASSSSRSATSKPPKPSSGRFTRPRRRRLRRAGLIAFRFHQTRSKRSSGSVDSTGSRTVEELEERGAGSIAPGHSRRLAAAERSSATRAAICKERSPAADAAVRTHARLARALRARPNPACARDRAAAVAPQPGGAAVAPVGARLVSMPSGRRSGQTEPEPSLPGSAATSAPPDPHPGRGADCRTRRPGPE